MTALTFDSALATFGELAGEVGERLASNREWGLSGQRVGQYAVDLDVDALCLDRLLSAGYQVLSEESGRQGPREAPMVVLDPLDGSTNASRGVGWFATAICLVDADGPAVAHVADHAGGRSYFAVRGQGATCNDVELSVSGCTEIDQAILGVSGLPTHHYGWGQFRAFGAAALDICAVASGSLDAWCDMSTDAHGVWDYLAAVLICTEAGGAVAEVEGRNLVVLDHEARRTPVVAASAELLEVVLYQRRQGARGATERSLGR